MMALVARLTVVPVAHRLMPATRYTFARNINLAAECGMAPEGSVLNALQRQGNVIIGDPVLAALSEDVPYE